MKLRVAISVAIATMLVAGALAQGQGGGRGQGRGQGGRGGNQNSITGLLNRPDVQEELKITDDQKMKLTALRPQRGAGGRGAGGAGGAGAGGAGGAAAGGARPDMAAMQKAQAEAEAKVMAVLDAGQQKRVKELFVQRAGNAAILNAGIAKELGITDDQKKSIAGLQKKQQEAMTALREKMAAGEVDRTAMMEANTKNAKTMDTELGKILTSEQSDKLKGMKGAPFTFKDAAGGN